MDGRADRVTGVETTSLVHLDAVEAAARRVAPAVRRTPLLASGLGRPAAPLWLKAECLQVGGSFKIRGATNAVGSLSAAERANGVITHSSGNHAQALARAARAAGTPAIVVMPEQAPLVKRRATAAQGAEVVLVDVADRVSAMERLRAERGAWFVPPFDDPAVIAGQGTVGLEIVDELPDVSTVFVPVGGGGLLSGVAVAVKARSSGARVVGVEPELAGDAADSFAAGERRVWDGALTARTIADSLRLPGVGVLPWLHIRALVDDVVTVSETAIRSAMRRIVGEEHLVCEPGGAVAVAGYLEHPDQAASGPAVAIVSGGNVEPDVLCDVILGGVDDRQGEVR